MGNCLCLCARGWGIDHQKRKNLQIPRNMPGGEWQEDKLNHALTEREEKVLLSSKSHRLVGNLALTLHLTSKFSILKREKRHYKLIQETLKALLHFITLLKN